MSTLHILISLFLPSFFLISCSISLDPYFVPSDQNDTQNECLDDQRSVLLQLQHDLHYAPNFTFSSKAELWDLNIDCCSWKGVRCDAFGHVIELDLSYKNLSGSFHSVFNLQNLQHLNLAGNNFKTTLFQYEFGKLPNLTHLDLSDSCFHDQIPMEISHLTRLVSLDLSNQDSCYRRNGQSDYYPSLKLEKPNFKSLIKNMRSLRRLYLDSVDISTQSSKWCETASLLLPQLSILSMSYCGLTGPVCSSLSNLHYLSELSLGGNPISYLPPNFLEIFSHLVSLNLSNCNLSGHFSSKVFLLPKMQSIDISSNYNLMGQLPEFPINNTLKVLSLDYTNFSGKLPESIGNLKLMTVLSLFSCSFSGSIPSSITNLTKLVRLDLSFNNFSGSIPPFHRFGVPNLAYIYLRRNHLSGSVSSSLFTLPSLHSLLLGYNQLVGEIDEFPNASSSLIESLDLRYNRFSFVKLEIFSQLKNLKALGLSNISLLIENNNKSLTFPQLKGLALDSCNLTGFPAFLKSQENLEMLSLSNNRISGVVPNWLWKKNLQYLVLSINSLSSLDQFLSIQSQTSSKDSLQRPICNLSQLWWFNVSYNKLSGSIPSCLGNISTLKYLDLQQNNFSGRIPDFTRATPLVTHQLRSLKINGNRLEGKLPRSLANCKKLQVLDLGKNMIHDTFPFWLEKLASLKVLVLRGNRFCGAIKVSGDENGFPMLRILDLASNNFSGELSVGFIQSLRGMKMMMTDGSKAKAAYIGDEYYQDSVTLVNKGHEMFYEKILTIFACLDLSNNSFHGRIPEEIQNLMSLKMLNLSYNNFFGHIPTTLGSLTELESLDLSQNELSGKIPSHLTSLTFLAVLNLSYNQLDGNIPQSYQFGTFSNDSYKGNPRLCGLPLTRKCNEVGPGLLPPKEDVDTWIDRLSGWEIVLIGYGCGLVIGLCIGYTVLNELGNKWVDSLTQNRNRKRRRCR